MAGLSFRKGIVGLVRGGFTKKRTSVFYPGGPCLHRLGCRTRLPRRAHLLLALTRPACHRCYSYSYSFVQLRVLIYIVGSYEGSGPGSAHRRDKRRSSLREIVDARDIFVVR